MREKAILIWGAHASGGLEMKCLSHRGMTTTTTMTRKKKKKKNLKREQADFVTHKPSFSYRIASERASEQASEAKSSLNNYRRLMVLYGADRSSSEKQHADRVRAVAGK